jgi:hypothetical protein
MKSDVFGIFLTYLPTIDSGIDVAPGINVAHGRFGKNIKPLLTPRRFYIKVHLYLNR